jgi:hypothetical protein
VGAINSMGEAIPAVRSRINDFFVRLQELSINAAVNVERLRVGWRRWMVAITEALANAGDKKALGELDAVNKKLADGEAHLGFMEDAAVELIAELYKMPPPLAAINTHLSGLDEEASNAAASLSALMAEAIPPRDFEQSLRVMGEIAMPALTRATEEATTATTAFGDEAGRIALRGIDDFAAFAVGAGDSLHDFVQGALQDLAKLLARLAIVGVLKAAIMGGAFGGGALAHGFLGLLEGRASGGPVRGGRPYMVGERGPEMFVPSGSGTIIPSGGGAALASMPPYPRVMSPREQAVDAWWREYFQAASADNSERG